MTHAEPGMPRAAQLRSGKWFVFVAVFIDMIGIGIAFPVLPILVGEYTTSNAAQTHWAIALSVTYSLMQFLCAPLLGAISDRFGRRVVLIAAILGLGLHYILIATASSLWIMLIARILGGMTGASFSVANAYLADISPPEERAKSFGLVGAAFGLGFICGPPLGGVLGAIDLHLPFYAAAALSLLNALYGYFFVPESLPPDRRGELLARQGQSVPRPHRAGPEPCRRQPRDRLRAVCARAYGDDPELDAVHPFPLRLGHVRERRAAVLRRHPVHRGAGRTARTPRQALRRGAARADRDRQQRARSDGLRARAARLDDVPDSVRQLPHLHRRSLDPGRGVEIDGADRAGRDLGRDAVDQQPGGRHRAVDCRSDSRRGQQPPAHRCPGRRAFLLLRGAQSGGVPARLAPPREAGRSA